jgi:hypothetical protein
MFRKALQVSLGSAAALLGSLASAQSVATVKELNPFTHVALIPAGADLNSIRLDHVKLVRVPTRVSYFANTAYCEEAAKRDSGGSAACPATLLEAPVSAYEVTYSYTGEPLASDEYGNRNFSFSVYYRPEELSADLRQKLNASKVRRAEGEGLFEAKTSRESLQRSVHDEAASKFCEGNFADGAWVRTDRRCQDQIKSKTVVAEADYISVHVEPSAPRISSR